MLRNLGPRLSGLLHPCDGLLMVQSRYSRLLVSSKPTLSCNIRRSLRCSAVRRRIRNSRSTTSKHPYNTDHETVAEPLQHTAQLHPADPSSTKQHNSAQQRARPAAASAAARHIGTAAASADKSDVQHASTAGRTTPKSSTTAAELDLSDASSEPFTPPPNTLCARLPTPTSQCLTAAESSFILRDYQVEAIKTVIQSWKQQVGAQLVMLPTGTGKTVVFAALARYMAQSFSRELAPPAAAVEAGSSSSSSGDGGSTAAAVAAAGSADEVSCAGGVMRGTGPVVAAAAASGDGGGDREQAAKSKDNVDPSSSSNGSSSSSSGSGSTRRDNGDERSGLEALSHAAAATTSADDSDNVDQSDFDHYHDSNHDGEEQREDNTEKNQQGDHEPANRRSDEELPCYLRPEMQAMVKRRFEMVAKTGNAKYFIYQMTDDGEFIVEDSSDEEDHSEDEGEDYGEYEDEGYDGYEDEDLYDRDDDLDEHDDDGSDDDEGDDEGDGDDDGYAAGMQHQDKNVDTGRSKGSSSTSSGGIKPPNDLSMMQMISSSGGQQQQQQQDLGSSTPVSSSRRRSRRSSTTSMSTSSRPSRRSRSQKLSSPSTSSSSSSSSSSDPSDRNPDQMRVLVLAHRGELLHQAAEKFDLIWPGVTISWVKGQRKNFWGQVVVASVQTAVNCIDQLRECGFSLVVVDEAHHSVANTYKEVLKGLGFVEELTENPNSSSSSSGTEDLDAAMEMAEGGGSSSSGLGVVAAASSAMTLLADSSMEEASYGPVEGSSSSSSTGSSSSSVLRALYSPHALLVGFTATPYRMRKDESAALYQIFVQTYTQNIVDMIRKKYLCKINSRKIFTEVDLKGARSLQGDFTPSTLAPIVNSPERNKLVLQAYLDYCTEPDAAGEDASSSSSSVGFGDDTRIMSSSMTASGRRAVRKTIGFAVDIAHAVALNEMFDNAGVKSAVVHSQVPPEENSRLLREFKQGELEVLWNVEKLTEGYDEPSLDAVLMARPTKSTGLYTQMLGRGLRRWPGKENCLVLDFTDKYHRADHVVDVRLLLDDDDSLFKNLDPLPPQPKERKHKLKLKGLQGGEVNVLGESTDPLELNWKSYGHHWMCDLFNMGKIWLVNMENMSNKQRKHLGIQDSTAAAAADDDHDHDEDDGMGAWQTSVKFSGSPRPDRYVVLHQPASWRDSDRSENNALTWKNATPHALHGMTASDAYGAALDYMSAVIKQQNQRSVRSRIMGKAYKPPAKLDTFRKDSSWREQPMGDKQRRFLTELKVSPQANWTKGQASDAIAEALCGLATPHQYEQLKAKLSSEEYESLPVPLLCAHARTLGAEP